MDLLVLGTRSPYLKGNHNGPGFLITYHNTKILLDAGNGITRLLDFPKDLENLHIFLSHYHSDHIGEIGCFQYASFVYHRLQNLKNKINIYLPKEDFEYNRKVIMKRKDTYAMYHDIEDGKTYLIDDLKITFQDNKSHSIPCFMIKIESDEGVIVYTSDIGNTHMEGVISFAKNADILICESSFCKQDGVESKTHLQAKEAAMIAKKAQVKKLCLTHFWPETPKEIYQKEAREIFKNSFALEEGQRIKIE